MWAIKSKYFKVANFWHSNLSAKKNTSLLAWNCKRCSRAVLCICIHTRIRGHMRAKKQTKEEEHVRARVHTCVSFTSKPTLNASRNRFRLRLHREKGHSIRVLFFCHSFRSPGVIAGIYNEASTCALKFTKSTRLLARIRQGDLFEWRKKGYRFVLRWGNSKIIEHLKLRSRIYAFAF